MTRPSGKIYTLSLFPAIDTTLYLEGMEPVRRYEPRKETRGPWQEAYGRYQELYRRLEQGKGE